MRRLLVDFGGVVIRTPFEMLHRVGSPAWFGPFDPAADPMWESLQRGEVTERAYWDARAREVFPGSPDPVRDLMGVLFAPPASEVRRPEVTALLAGVDRPAVLTNDLGRFHGPEWLEEMEAHNLFDPLIDLSHTGLLKPAAEAYLRALELLDELPSRVVFVDDQPYNVAGALEMGLVGVWFDVTDPSGSVGRVQAALG
jgi:putative hydrolase of the HAD superfamily